MKRLAVFVLILLSAKMAHGGCFDENTNFSLYRTTIIAGAWTNALVATSPVCIAEIEVTSAVVGSSFQIFNSTWANGKQSTSAVYDTSSSLNRYEPRFILSIGTTTDTDGFMFTSIGGSTIVVKWDWLYSIPVGQEAKGRF